MSQETQRDRVWKAGTYRENRFLLVFNGLTAWLFSFSVLLPLVFLAVVSSLSPVQAQSARQSVEVAVSSEANFGRMVLTFTGLSLLPEHTVSTQNNILVVTFSDSVDLSLDNVVEELGNYVSIARADPTGTGIRLALLGGVRINTMEAGEKLFIDFLPRGWSGLPPSLPEDVVLELARRAEAALKAAEAERRRKSGRDVLAQVELRVGQHPTFTRFVFAWNVPFDTSFIREDDFVTISFDQDIDLDLSEVRADLPDLVTGIDAISDEGKLKVVMGVEPTADIRAFREDNTYVVDISGDPDHDKSKTAEKLADDAMKMAKAEAGGGASQDVTAPGLRRVTGSGSGADPVSDLLQSTDVRDLSLKDLEALTQDKPEDSGDNGQAGEAGNGASDKAPETRPVVVDQSVGRGNPEQSPILDDSALNDTVRAHVTRVGNAVRVALPFAEPTPSALFRRGNAVWMVFDSKRQLDLAALRDALSDSLRDLSVNQSKTSIVVRVALDSPQLATLAADGTGWIVTIGDMILEPTKPLKLTRGILADGRAMLKTRLPGYGAIHQIDDLDGLDTILVATALSPARGFIRPHRFVELETLISGHGLAVIPHVDDLRAYFEDDQVIITRTAGLNISSAGGRAQGRKQSGRKAFDRPGFLDFSQWEVARPDLYSSALGTLQTKTATADDEAKTGWRLQQARFLIANQRGTESLGLFRIIREENPRFEQDAGFNTLEGAALVMANRPHEALALLNDTQLRKNPDSAIWRALAADQLRDWNQVRSSTHRGYAVLNSYPEDIRSKFLLASVAGALDVNDFGNARRYMSEIEPRYLDEAMLARYDLLRGQFADAGGKPKEAVAAYEQARSSRYLPISEQASYELTRLKFRDGLIEREEAIEDLAQLTTRWRGDDTELRALRMLGRLQAESGEYRAAFEAMKAAVYADADSQTTRLLQNEMNAVFASLFLEGKADKLPAVKALSLYYDFRELTPIGRRGDEMVRRLADRLVEIELLDQAAELLSHQVENRLKGAARAQIAADLGVIYLMDRKPHLALNVLRRTKQSQMPPSLKRQRKIVEARALLDLSRADLALELLQPMTGPEADRLRADTYWEAERWQDAAEQLERMYANRWSDPVELRGDEQQDLLRMAIGYSLAGDEVGLGRVRAKYQTKMAETAQATAFDSVTQPINSQGFDFRAVAAQVASVDTLETFLNDYRHLYGANRGGASSSDEPADA